MLTGIATLAMAAMFVIAASMSFPALLGDENAFMKSFIGAEYLNLLGVMLTITLASVGPLYLQLRRLESKIGNRVLFSESRSRVKQAAYCLVFLFAAGVSLVVLKPIFLNDPISGSLFNGACLLILLWYLLILCSLTDAFFALIDNDEV